jgi:hypothetical protein
MRLTDSDAGFLYTETASGPMQISSIYVLDGEAPFDRLFHHFETRIHLVPRYRQRLAMVPFNLAHPKWVDDPDFDLAYHVRHHRLERTMSLEEAVDEAMILNQQVLDRRRPLWLTYVIEGVPGKTLLLQLIHHAMIDGVSGIELTTVLYDYDPSAADPPAPDAPWQPAEPPGALALMNEAAHETLDKLRHYNPIRTLGSDETRRALAAQAARVVSGTGHDGALERRAGGAATEAALAQERSAGGARDSSRARRHHQRPGVGGSLGRRRALPGRKRRNHPRAAPAHDVPGQRPARG